MSTEKTPTKWCEEDDYEIRGRQSKDQDETESSVPVPKHIHLDKHRPGRVKFEDGTIQGSIIAADQERETTR